MDDAAQDIRRRLCEDDGKQTAQASRDVGRLLRSFYLNHGGSGLLDVVDTAFAPEADIALITTFTDLLWNRNPQRTAHIVQQLVNSTRTRSDGASQNAMTPVRMATVLATAPFDLHVSHTTRSLTLWADVAPISLETLDALELALLHRIAGHRSQAFFETVVRVEPSRDIVELRDCRFNHVMDARVSRARLIAHYVVLLRLRVGPEVREAIAAALAAITSPTRQLPPMIAAEPARFRELVRLCGAPVLDVGAVAHEFFAPPVHIR